MKDNSLQGLINDLLHNPDPNLRREAAEALDNVREKAAIEPLFQALQDKNGWVAHTAAKSLASFGEAVIPRLIQIMQTRDKNMPSIEALTKEIGRSAALKQYMEYVNTNYGGSATFAAHALGFSQDARAVEPLIETLKSSAYNPPLRGATTSALGNMGEPALLPLIRTLLDKQLDYWVHKEVARALGDIGDARAFDTLMEIINNEQEHNDLRIAAINALQKIGDSRAVEPLIQILQRPEPNLAVQAVAAAALGKLGAEAKAALKELNRLARKKELASEEGE
jgi:HEAT repeat protein